MNRKVLSEVYLILLIKCFDVNIIILNAGLCAGGGAVALRHWRATRPSKEDVGKLTSERERKLVIQDSQELSEIKKTAKTARNFYTRECLGG